MTSSAQPRDNTWRRLFAVDRISATPTACAEKRTTIAQGPNLTTSEDMGAELGDGGKRIQEVAPVQPGIVSCSPGRYVSRHASREEQLRLILSVPEPRSVSRVARALAWDEWEAIDALDYWKAKRVLRARRGRIGGHYLVGEEEGTGT